MNIKKSILLFIIIPIASFSQTDSLFTKTYFIGNRHFIVYNSIMNFKIDSLNGEDLKSKYSHYLKQLNIKYPKWKDKTTIACGTMNIDLNITNNTKSSWKIEAIRLIVISKKEIRIGQDNIHEWPYRIRGEEDEINLYISNNKESFIYLPKNIILNKQNNGDNLLNITINTEKNTNKNMIINFKIEIDIVELGTASILKIPSDKTYYYCTYNE